MSHSKRHYRTYVLYAVIIGPHRHADSPAPHLAFLLVEHYTGYTDVFQIEAKEHYARFRYYNRKLLTGELPQVYYGLATIPFDRHTAFEQLFHTVHVGAEFPMIPCPCATWNSNVVAELYEQGYINGSQKAGYEGWVQSVLGSHAYAVSARYVEDIVIKQEEEEEVKLTPYETPRRSG